MLFLEMSFFFSEYAMYLIESLNRVNPVIRFICYFKTNDADNFWWTVVTTFTIAIPTYIHFYSADE